MSGGEAEKAVAVVPNEIQSLFVGATAVGTFALVASHYLRDFRVPQHHKTGLSSRFRARVVSKTSFYVPELWLHQHHFYHRSLFPGKFHWQIVSTEMNLEAAQTTKPPRERWRAKARLECDSSRAGGTTRSRACGWCRRVGRDRLEIGHLSGTLTRTSTSWKTLRRRSRPRREGCRAEGSFRNHPKNVRVEASNSANWCHTGRMRAA